MRLWIDTDVGDDPDDAVALLCARAHPEVDLVGVSTVDGDHARRATRAGALVDAPVHRGDEPQLGTAVHEARPEALLAIGPLTNVAALVASEPRLPPVTVMGGVLGQVAHRGQMRTVEHNFARDPGAAATVLRSAVPVLVVPLDVTVSMCLDEAQQHRLTEEVPTLAGEVEAWQHTLGRSGVPAGERRVCLHDPLALLALVEPGLVRVERRRVRVDPDGSVVADAAAAAQRVVRSVDAPRALERALELATGAMG